jgi:hypothetical protein
LSEAGFSLLSKAFFDEIERKFVEQITTQRAELIDLLAWADAGAAPQYHVTCVTSAF